eukprot:193628-Prymnesium_polylepis.1
MLAGAAKPAAGVEDRNREGLHHRARGCGSRLDLAARLRLRVVWRAQAWVCRHHLPPRDPPSKCWTE